MGFKDLKLLMLINGAINAHSYGSGNQNTRVSISLNIDQLKTIRALLDRPTGQFKRGDRVRKKGDKGQWHGHIVGEYSATCTTVGYTVESERETGSVQIYPESALELYEEETND